MHASCAGGAAPNVLLYEMTRRQIREGIASGQIRGAIVPVGSTEQHNEHLALIHDTASVLHIAERAAQRLYPTVVVAPPICVGVSEHWMEHPGTLTVRADLFAEYLFDICHSLKRAGLRCLLILNGHGGNIRPIRERLQAFRSRLGIPVGFHSYWEGYSKELVAECLQTRQCPGHAGEFETSFALAAFPHRVHWEDASETEPNTLFADFRRAEQDRLFREGAHCASAEKGQRLIEFAVEWTAEQMKALLEAPE